jgi:hypothetical protein
MAKIGEFLFEEVVGAEMRWETPIFDLKVKGSV